MMPRSNGSSPFDEADPLDRQLDRALGRRARGARRGSIVPRLIAGWTASSVPVALLLLTGIALGSEGIGLLSPAALAILDPIVPVALAGLGVLVGLGVDTRRAESREAFEAAAIDIGVVMAFVGSGTALLLRSALPADAAEPIGLGLLAGICAVASSMLPTGERGEPSAPGMRVVELGVVASIIMGGLMLVVIREGTFMASVMLAAQAGAVVAVLASAGWLLLTAASSGTEQRVFAIAALLLLGGAADYLSLSALAAGLIAGVVWQLVGGELHERIRRDVLYVQHPLVVLVLLVAGARVELTLRAVGIALAYVFLRATAKLISSMMMKRGSRSDAPRDVRWRLLSPGVFGVALAVNAVRAGDQDVSVIFTAIVVGTIGSELLAALLREREVPE